MARAWFDDVELSATGSKKRVSDAIIQATTTYARCLSEQGLEMADKSVIISNNMGMAHSICKHVRQRGIHIKAATTGRDLGQDRAGRTPTSRPTHSKRR
eukprot:1563339-Pyramimonas_sp.AAC.1